MITREVHIHRADGFRNEEVEPVIICIDRDQQTPDYGSAEDAAEATALFKSDAKALADALFDACPGGTISELIAELLERRACHFRVRFPQQEETRS